MAPNCVLDLFRWKQIEFYPLHILTGIGLRIHRPQYQFRKWTAISHSINGILALSGRLAQSVLKLHFLIPNETE
jgi:hypothetical protein